MYVKADKKLFGEEKAIIEDELNVKNVEFDDDVSAYTTYSFKPQLRTVGPKYGKHLGKIKEHLSALDGNAAMAELKAEGALKFEADGEEIVLTEADLLIDMAQMDGFVSEADGGVTVVIDTNLSEELLEEGFVREIVSKVQTMRKEAGFEVMDKITVYADGSQKANDIIAANADAIIGDVMATEIITGSVDGYSKEWNINGEKVTLGVKKN